MDTNEISDDEKLNTILRRLRANDGFKGLADRIEAIIDQGTSNRAGRLIEVDGNIQSKTEVNKRLLTEKESLEVAVNILRAYFLELPMIFASIQNEFSFAVFSPDIDCINETTSAYKNESVRKPKEIQIELKTETTRFNNIQEMYTVPVITLSEVKKQKKVFENFLRVLQ